MNGNTISRTSTNHSIISTTSHKSSLQQSNLPKKTTTSSLSTNSNTIDIDSLIDKLLNAGFSGKRTKNVCLKNTEIEFSVPQLENFLSQPSLLELAPPVKVVGDVHGQYHDNSDFFFSKCGFPPKTNYLFLGDYVDSKQSLETILLLLCYKIKYPENFFYYEGIMNVPMSPEYMDFMMNVKEDVI